MEITLGIIVLLVIILVIATSFWMRRSALLRPRAPVARAEPPRERAEPPEPLRGGDRTSELQSEIPAPASIDDLRSVAAPDDFSQPQASPGGEKTKSAPMAEAGNTPSIPAEAQPATPPSVATEEVRFTAFHPKEVAVEQWYTLLVYAHLESMTSKVKVDASRFKAEMGTAPREVHASSGAQLARGSEITVLPAMDGVEFNPERITFRWVEDMHRAEFRMQAAEPLAGLAGTGTVTIFVGPLIVATIKFGMLFDEAGQVPQLPTESTSTQLYKQDQIFASYSHRDAKVVTACRDAYRALGYELLIDVDDLRAGENWNQAILNMIERADIFQLFWSPNSAESKYCRQEWQYALQKSKDKGEGFIRPVYWEKPLVPPPAELEPIHFAYVPLARAD